MKFYLSNIDILVFLLRPEAKWSSHKQVDDFINLRTEPVYVENTGMIYD